MMRIFLLLLLLPFTIVQQAHSQSNPDAIYAITDVDQHPVPAKGLDDLYKQFMMAFRYPADARINNIQGTVNLSFVVDKKGKVSDITVADGLGYGADEAVLTAFRQINIKWKPGIKEKKKVNVSMVLPFKLRLE